MVLTIGFSGDETIYIQLRSQIILKIAMRRIHGGDSLPSARQLADNIGISMHTTGKAYSVLRQEGFVKLDRRKGAVICLDVDKLQALEEMRQRLAVVLTTGIYKNISREGVRQIVGEIYDIFQNEGKQTGNSHRISEMEEPYVIREM